MIGFIFLVMGCATEYVRPSQQTVVLSSGEFVDYVSVDAKDHTGTNSRVVDRYYKNPKTGELVLLTKSDFNGQGIVNGFMSGGFAGLAQGAGFATGMALLRPSSTNVNNDNSGSSNGSAGQDGATGGPSYSSGAAGAAGAGAAGATSSGITVNNSAVSSPVQNQTASQTQSLKSSIKNTNTNSNINKNTNTNSNVNRNTNTNTNINKGVKFNHGNKPKGNPPYGNAWGHGHGSGKPDKD
jgi:hypothetical protein